MPAAPLPENEPQRLASLASLSLLDGTRDEWTDDLVQAASSMTDCPIGLVTIVEAERQWFRGCIGLDVTGTPREQAFCGYTILSKEPLVVRDALQDPRFVDNPLVTGEPHIRFYAGVPIYDDEGIALGSLCVIDSKPRELSAYQIRGLVSMARLVSTQISMARRHDAILSASLDAIITINSSSEVIEFNETATAMFGYERSEAIGASLANLIIPPELREAHHQGMKRYLATGEGPALGKRIEITAIRRNGAVFPVELAISPTHISGKRCFTAFVRDISDTNELNAALRLTRFTVDHARDAVMWVAPDASFTYVNETACERLGYSADELLTKKVFDIDSMLGPADWAAHWDDLRKKRSLLLESVHRCRDGTSFPVEVACNYIVHEGKEFNCAVARDVTDRKAAEHALAESEERFRDIAEAAGEYIWETDVAGQFTFASGPLEAQLGRSRPEIIGYPMPSFLIPDHASSLIKLMKKAADEREPFRNVELCCRFVDGSVRWQRLSGKALFDEAGLLAGYRGMGLDITEFKVAAEMRRRVVTLQNMARSVIALFLDPDAYQRAVARMLSVIAEFYLADRATVFERQEGGWSVDARWGMPYQGQTETSLCQETIERHASVANPLEIAVFHFEHGEVWSLGVPVAVDRDVSVYVLFESCRLNPPPTPTEIELLSGIRNGMGHAIERSRSKAELIDAAKKLEAALILANQASDAKTAFLAHMSHELRTPLTAVLGFGKVLRSSQHSEASRQSILAKIDQNGQALLGIINSILDLTKIETGAATIRTETVLVSDIIEAASSSFAGTAHGMGLHFEATIEGDVPVSFRTDPMRVVQILTNLVSNAAKYTDHGRVDLIISTLDGVPAQIRFEVRDTGRGISHELQRRVFDAFDRGAASGDGGGTGLGLAIVSRLVELLGGSVSLESKLGSGSTFKVTLPLVDPSEERMARGVVDLDSTLRPASDDTIARTRLDGMRILLAEDSEHVREVVQYFLRDRGASVRLCAHGHEAVSLLLDGDERVDLVLMDMQMPVLDGYEATRELRRRGYRGPVVALTAHGMQHDRDRCLAAGCDDYLSKPIDPELLAAVCSRLVRRDSAAEVQAPRAAGSAEPAAFSLDSLVARFRIHLGEELKALISPSAMTDFDSTRRRVHKLAGSAGNLGFPQITSAALACESLIRSGAETERIRGALDDLVRVIRDSIRPE